MVSAAVAAAAAAAAVNCSRTLIGNEVRFDIAGHGEGCGGCAVVRVRRGIFALPKPNEA